MFVCQMNQMFTLKCYGRIKAKHIDRLYAAPKFLNIPLALLEA